MIEVVYFDEKITGTKATTRQNSCVPVPLNVVSVARNLRTTKERNKKTIITFDEGITGNNATNHKTFLSSSLGESYVYA
jgi:hypothetical protein